MRGNAKRGMCAEKTQRSSLLVTAWQTESEQQGTRTSWLKLGSVSVPPVRLWSSSINHLTRASRLAACADRRPGSSLTQDPPAPSCS